MVKDFKKLSERQQNILRFMNKYMKRTGFPPTIREIGEATGINSTSVVNYNLNKLVDAGYLARSDKVSRGLRLISDIPGTRRRVKKTQDESLKVALVGQIVASAPVEVPDEFAYDEEDLIDVPPNMLGGVDPENAFALQVKGNSMIDAMIQEGDIVILKKQDVANNGDMVAVWLTERGETTLKHFFNEGEQIRLQPAHPTMEPIYVDANECLIMGRVLSVMREVKTARA